MSSVPAASRTSPSGTPDAAMSVLAEHAAPHGRRVHGQRFHAAEAGRPAGIPQPAEEGVGGLEAAGELDGEHAAEAAHLAGGQRVLWVGRQAGVVHPGHGRVVLQRLGEGLAVVVVPGHAQRQGAQAAQQQPGVERAERGAGEQGDVPDPVQELPPGRPPLRRTRRSGR